ncbi:thiamine pyrophosphate enzyme, N-terminal TPP binding domain-containing protein [Ilyonectria robusta]|uniref:thiamine pyrophosphate enzyme, N-terminal TPP binding domain-containing protein n=1 Tax=Ilyonectria robusta TaxID=1079257 RepID=UPI001E8D50BF|nr:thiamine pyrophosphate enzyme, N-terminal TPP binding domain-containing protein [Ilyonectria robusta]KAH8650763.1 thiamine pyrophosphate enzyme, N-terminal TPP binding domain-containing protein [Ilyonectria robusta]
MAFKIQQPVGRPLTGGDLLAQSLKALGVDVSFGLGGGHLDGFLLGCEHASIRLIDTRHETAAIQAAEGYARTTGKVGSCFVTANSGFLNGLPGLGTALADRNPICCITSSQPPKDVDSNGLQGFHDQIVVAKTLAKFVHRITDNEEIPRVVAYAFRQATVGAPGPVVIDLPVSLMFAPVNVDAIQLGAINSPMPAPPAPDKNAIITAAALWRSAERPIIITGSKSKLLSSIAEITNTPVFHTTSYGPSIPVGHPLQAGFANRLALLLKNEEPRPDLVILIGTRTGTFLGGRGGRIIPKEGCKVVHVEADGSELGKICHVDVSITSSPEQALEAFKSEIEKGQWKASKAWATRLGELKDAYSFYEKDPETNAAGQLHPYHALKQAFSALKHGAIICADGGESSFWALDMAQYATPSAVMYTCGYLGFLGNGWGYALGAAVGNPTRQVINVQGDGSAGFHIAELDTYARFDLNILTIIMNNHVWGMSLHAQDILFADRIKARPAALLSSGTAYEVVAQGFENASAKVTTMDEIDSTVRELSADPRPACINMIVSGAPTHHGLEALVMSNLEPNTVRIPYFAL